MSDEVREQELADLEAALRSLRPRASRLDRDRLMFLAGQVSARDSASAWAMRFPRWLWPTVAAALAIVSVGLGWMLALRRQPSGPAEGFAVERPLPAPPIEPEWIDGTTPWVVVPSPVRFGGPPMPTVPVPVSAIRDLTSNRPQARFADAAQPMFFVRAGRETIVVIVVPPSVQQPPRSPDERL